MNWIVLTSAFLASVVEFVEAFTIVLVVGLTINWRSSFVGAALAALSLAVLIGVFGVALVQYVPIDVLRLVVGVILVLFGLKWLKKAILRYSGNKALHDEEAIYEAEVAAMRQRGETKTQGIDTFGVITSFKSVLLEGLEVAFIVITFGSTASDDHLFGAAKGSIGSATIGALAAFVLVVILGAAVRAPLSRIPENTLKFGVGIMLTSFGTFWGGEGLGIAWWNADASLLFIIAGYLLASGALVLWLKPFATRTAAPKPRPALGIADGGSPDLTRPLTKEESSPR